MKILKLVIVGAVVGLIFSPEHTQAKAATAQAICKINGKYLSSKKNAARMAQFRNYCSGFNRTADASGGGKANVSAVFGRKSKTKRDLVINYSTSKRASSRYSGGTVTLRSNEFNRVVLSHEVGHAYGCRHGVNRGGTNQNSGTARGHKFRVGKRNYATLMRVNYEPKGTKYTATFSNPNKTKKIGNRRYKLGDRTHNCAARLNAASGGVSRRNNKR